MEKSEDLAIKGSGVTTEDQDTLLNLEGEARVVRLRTLRGKVGTFAYIVGVLMTLFHLYVLYVTSIDPWLFRGGHLVFASILVFLLIPANTRSPKDRPSVVDGLLIVASVATIIYVILDFRALMYRAGGALATPADMLFGLLAVIVVMEMMRRTSGYALPIIALFFIVYALVGPQLPGMLWHRGYSFNRIISFLFSPVGIYTIPLGVSAQYVFIFILFGTFLQRSGAGELFIKLALAVTGRSRGGIAKVPIISSALFGTISGSAVANVIVDGYLTIPPMKRAGFRAAVAGAIEAVASTGGQLMPPVMGAAAFLMSEVVGIPYYQIAIAAAIPAILYYVSLYWMVDFEAAKMGIQGLSRDKLPNLRRLIAGEGYLLLPLLGLIFVLVVMESSPTRAALWAILITLGSSWLKRERIFGLKGILDVMATAARGTMDIAATCAGAGIVIGILSLTGLGLKATSIILGFAGGNLWLALFLSMIITIILGMGLPTVAAYATAAAVIPPVLTQMGIPELAAHMFIFYFACLATITPPVAIAAYAAAAIAEAPMWAVGWTAVRIGLAGFIVPYMFVFGRELLFQGGPAAIGLAVLSALLGTTALAAAVQGWLLTRLTPVERVLLLAAALLLIKPGLLTDLMGYGIFAVIFAIQKVASRRKALEALDRELAKS
ncbi:Tripartite ATP-independent periplasmic transporter, DctM component [Neomoorella glycerini]|uniref:Tripartite ATP-independent periplasmic transporter, DctM component n=1 Tax=Neomoorella glycerini TaxID=55779 RepID=A0A6I5ZN14_9FIRM|nr:TRAP transporter fused permease subunit [Moorella glycerini]QGP90989.1 Tripartite ATP-independent periplasmic transporter, DctM component [Moorella glycerini]